ASQAQNLGAKFTPTGRLRRVSLKIKTPRIKARWVTSVGRGTLTVRGTVTAQANVRLELRRPGGGPLVIRRSTLAAGPFQLRQTLRPGPLMGHATLRPGGFVVALRGHAGGVRLPLEVRTLSVGAPPEGVVGKAYASMTGGGRAVKRVPAGAKEAWA